MPDRAQLSMTLLEAGLAVVLIFGVTGLILVADADPDGDTGGRAVNQFAVDVGHLITGSTGTPSIDRVLATNTSFAEYRDDIETTIRAALPPGYFFRIQTAYGGIGYPKPAHVELGQATVQSFNGTVTIWVWSP